ncbi:hypothetical protein [Bizionia arctica]|uniref:Uncharacterized protein n=1 Tax=Bizionia arctica TaxID=1495645 RepID=A0A917LJS4_9FLAO|nr:hypothetical protein [Bizionia arctica]GGG35168.1 hypothetical protein GCM10010976_03540 [Bizionia arctica]
MNRFIFALFFLAASMQSLLAQKTVLKFKNEEVSRRTSKETLTLSNTINQDLTVLLVEGKDIYAYLYDVDFNLKQEFETNAIKSKYKDALGYKIDGLKQHILFSNNQKTKFAVMTLDFDSKESYEKEVLFDFKDETFVETVNYKNQVYLLSATDDNVIHIRILDKNLNFSSVNKITIDGFEENKVILKEAHTFGLFYVLGDSKSSVKKIDHRVPGAIELTSSDNKLFQFDNLVYLTFENNETATLVYKINFDDFSYSYKSYDYPKGTKDDFKRYNSYIYEDYFFQIASSKDEMKFLVNNLDGTLIKSFSVYDNKAITFKNGPIIQDGATGVPFVNRRELEESSKYLRKISTGNVGISVLKQDDLFYITLGGYVVVNTASANPMMGGTSVNSAGLVTYNPTYFSYNSYSNTKSTYFNTKLDPEFNHIKGTIDKNVFEIIKSYTNKYKYITAEDVFFHNGTLYFSFFNLKDSEYNIVTF